MFVIAGIIVVYCKNDCNPKHLDTNDKSHEKLLTNKDQLSVIISKIFILRHNVNKKDIVIQYGFDIST